MIDYKLRHGLPANEFGDTAGTGFLYLELAENPDRRGGLLPIAQVYGIPINARLEDVPADSDGVQRARRLAACWNACRGVPTGELEARDRPDRQGKRDRVRAALERALRAEAAAAGAYLDLGGGQVYNGELNLDRLTSALLRELGTGQVDEVTAEPADPARYGTG